jgi:hypothetical protein
MVSGGALVGEGVRAQPGEGVLKRTVFADAQEKAREEIPADARSRHNARAANKLGFGPAYLVFAQKWTRLPVNAQSGVRLPVFAKKWTRLPGRKKKITWKTKCEDQITSTTIL